MSTKGLQVGAGRAEVVFTDEMFPNFGERYSHVHDNPAVQVIALEAGERYGIVALTLVIAPKADVIKEKVAAILGTKPENVIVHAKHALATPHLNGGGTTAEDIKKRMHGPMGGGPVTDEEAEMYAQHDNLMSAALMDAIEKAAKDAAAAIRPAKMGIGYGYSDANINRVLDTPQGCLESTNPDGVTDRVLPVIRFDDEAGEPIAVLFSVNTAAGVLENSRFADGRRAVSADIAGVSESFVDAEYKGVVSAYILGATGDQWQSLRARKESVDRAGNQTVVDLGEGGFVLVDVLGSRLGQQVVKTTETIETAPFDGEIKLDYFSATLPAQARGGPGGPVKGPQPTEAQAGYAVMQLGDTALVFIGVEMGVRTYAYIKENSPFKNTIVVEFSSCGAGGGYMVEKDLYEKKTRMSGKSGYAAGSAELFREEIVKTLKTLK